MMAYQETVVRRDQHRIHVRDHSGTGPPIILCTGSRTTYTSTTAWFLTSRRHAESFYLIFLGGEVRISHPAILIPPPIKSVTWMPSLPNWGLSKSFLSRTTPRAHRPLTGHWPNPSAWP